MDTNSDLQHHTFTDQHLDFYLLFRIILARLGEKPRFQWWDRGLDATDEAGGATFFQNLLQDEAGKIGQLSAAEATIESAKSIELKRLSDANYQGIFLSIFLAPSILESELNDRWFHWKRFPEDIPEIVSKAIDMKSDKDVLLSMLNQQLAETTSANTEGTSFGLKVKNPLTVKNELSVHNIFQLVKLVKLEKGDWTFPYYE